MEILKVKEKINWGLNESFKKKTERVKDKIVFFKQYGEIDWRKKKKENRMRKKEKRKRNKQTNLKETFKRYKMQKKDNFKIK